ncbi:40S ribosomal protein S7, putative [Entamoeba invadens IP1]|uniref:40S ribosomal protein S7 n=1 Tax=Entamoeba invadens IP1 TaxID=370355 RepID=A0A0A1U6B0_ENTIV|nr:40S ribosomal protein S7, putative [Entamoeba invadens IP1]ELP87366.1 40S ribosomal protein S7, putative [Entamoeba invadens IP1]|eukprot:XP_004254137.1 40S ribosomal protein S7, putative [Entamoeba invadens IP1]
MAVAVEKKVEKNETPIAERKPGMEPYSVMMRETVAAMEKSIPEMKLVKVHSARKIPTSKDKFATVVFVPLRMMRKIRPIQAKLVDALEKKMNQPVFIIGKRIVAHAARPGQADKSEYKPISRTRKAVHEAYMNEMLYPVQIIAQRIRVSMHSNVPEGRKTVSLGVDDLALKNTVKARLNVYSSVYKVITGNEVAFDFPLSA